MTNEQKHEDRLLEQYYSWQDPQTSASWRQLFQEESQIEEGLATLSGDFESGLAALIHDKT